MPPKAKPFIQEGRRLVKFSLADYREGHQDCQGWHNWATWAWNLYFFQERDLNDEFRALAKNGKVSGAAAMRLFKHAQETNRMEQVEADTEGVVMVREIISFWENENKP